MNKWIVAIMATIAVVTSAAIVITAEAGVMIATDGNHHLPNPALVWGGFAVAIFFLLVRFEKKSN